MKAPVVVALLSAIIALPALPAHAAPYPPAKIAKKEKRKLPKRHALWLAIGRCEQPGRGYGGVNWKHRGPTYQGGLGFWYGTWASFKEPKMPSNAGDASWRHQMWVANKLYARYGGTSPWGCG